jgi:hypothetical protein
MPKTTTGEGAESIGSADKPGKYSSDDIQALINSGKTEQEIIELIEEARKALRGAFYNQEFWRFIPDSHEDSRFNQLLSQAIDSKRIELAIYLLQIEFQVSKGELSYNSVMMIASGQNSELQEALRSLYKDDIVIIYKLCEGIYNFIHALINSDKNEQEIIDLIEKVRKALGEDFYNQEFWRFIPDSHEDSIFNQLLSQAIDSKHIELAIYLLQLEFQIYNGELSHTSIKILISEENIELQSELHSLYKGELISIANLCKGIYNFINALINSNKNEQEIIELIDPVIEQASSIYKEAKIRSIDLHGYLHNYVYGDIYNYIYKLIYNQNKNDQEVIHMIEVAREILGHDFFDQDFWHFVLDSHMHDDNKVPHLLPNAILKGRIELAEYLLDVGADLYEGGLSLTPIQLIISGKNSKLKKRIHCLHQKKRIIDDENLAILEAQLGIEHDKDLGNLGTNLTTPHMGIEQAQHETFIPSPDQNTHTNSMNDTLTALHTVKDYYLLGSRDHLKALESTSQHVQAIDTSRRRERSGSMAGSTGESSQPPKKRQKCKHETPNTPSSMVDSPPLQLPTTPLNAALSTAAKLPPPGQTNSIIDKIEQILRQQEPNRDQSYCLGS